MYLLNTAVRLCIKIVWRGKKNSGKNGLKEWKAVTPQERLAILLLNLHYIRSVYKNSEKSTDTSVRAAQTMRGGKEWHGFPWKIETWRRAGGRLSLPEELNSNLFAVWNRRTLSVHVTQSHWQKLAKDTPPRIDPAAAITTRWPLRWSYRSLLLFGQSDAFSDSETGQTHGMDAGVPSGLPQITVEIVQLALASIIIVPFICIVFVAESNVTSFIKPFHSLHFIRNRFAPVTLASACNACNLSVIWWCGPKLCMQILCDWDDCVWVFFKWCEINGYHASAMLWGPKAAMRPRAVHYRRSTSILGSKAWSISNQVTVFRGQGRVTAWASSTSKEIKEYLGGQANKGSYKKDKR